MIKWKFGIELEWAGRMSELSLRQIKARRPSEKKKHGPPLWTVLAGIPEEEVKTLNLKLGTDLSAKTEMQGKGYEFRTVRPFEELPEKEVKIATEFISRFGCISNQCGMHIHFSGKRLTYEEYLWLAREINRYKVWKSRQGYCDLFLGPDIVNGKRELPDNLDWVIGYRLDEYGKMTTSEVGCKYYPVRIVSQPEGHYEVRVFNGTKSARAVRHNFEFLQKLLSEL